MDKEYRNLDGEFSFSEIKTKVQLKVYPPLGQFYVKFSLGILPKVELSWSNV